jgi:uncharacterized membrane protein YeaQ/YmgE (transglycosylase-associated protein family)
METFAWIVIGSLLGWVGFSRFHFNEERGRNVSMLLGAAGALIGGKAIAPMFVSPGTVDFTAPGAIFAAATAAAVLALGNLVSNRWGV